MRFRRPPAGTQQRSQYLFVANCGPSVGDSYADIQAAFSKFGVVTGVHAADDSGTRVIVCYDSESAAAVALEELNGRSCANLGGRSLHVRYSVRGEEGSRCQVDGNASLRVLMDASELNIPGLYLLRDFVTCAEEEELLAAVDARPWDSLSKRRVQHYGYEFRYDTRNVDPRWRLGELPEFVSHILQRLRLFPGTDNAAALELDQLTVNEYPRGVGLSPHIDTHSAFEGFIFSLSLAGPCIMEFRKYMSRACLPRNISNMATNEGKEDNRSPAVVRKAIYLPPRSMLLLSGEARYAWQHYIPHHKIDFVMDEAIKRNSRRVSFTFRKVRIGSCNCSFPQHCDSQILTRGNDDT
ncbi:hypothetical protein MLD38_037722 [Melastoma candidum]|uniref:Uncharacterized protein n=1 Tax=Melastoma candidum TaxID=119954 RepID=A0ACB9LP81_9MYRT|nr:hypothetical protein MLD38_037722 [Melastoma candidum]